MITDVPGVRVGHWTDEVARTGCTVALLPSATVASGEVRGGAPATREWDLLAPERRVAHLDAVVLSGGSAFGLAAADGVMRFCEERGMGHPTAAGPVPIVVAASLYDLMVGDGSVRPGPEQGYAACVAATDGAFPTGSVGAGTGASVGTWLGPEKAGRGGLGSASARIGDLVVGALVVVNAYGSVLGPGEEPPAVVVPEPSPAFSANTTIGVIVTEMLASLGGVGFLISYHRTLFNTGHVYFGIVLALMMAVAVNVGLTWLDHRVGLWRILERTDG